MCSTLAPRGGDGGGIPDPRQAVDAVLDLLPTLRILSLTGGGEPLLGAATAGILDRMAAFPDAAVCLTTNGVLLDEAWLGRLVRARVLGVNVSVNAATRGTYQAICGVDAFERLIGNVRRLVEVAASLRPRPLVRLSMVVQDENLSELPEFLRMTAGLGTAVSLHPVAGEDGAPAGLFADPQGLRAVESLLRTKVLPLLPALPASHRQEVQALLAIVRDRRRAANPP
jgi:MoaA/NifB/PqqE/SkfB family radical SAM enzyme